MSSLPVQNLRHRALRTAAIAARPWMKHELPGWGRLFAALSLGGIDNCNSVWAGGPQRRERGKLHGMVLRLDLSRDLDRFVWFVGRYYDLPVQLAARALLRPGDVCVDVGANVGHFSALAAHLVGPQGRVIAFEPNPDCVTRLQHIRDDNALKHLDIRPYALGSSPGNATLHLLGGDSILGTLAAGGAPHHRGAVSVDVAAGDAELLPVLSEGGLMKIDVEGFEAEVLRGLSRCLAERQPALIVEMSASNLARAGSSCGEVARMLAGHGYTAYSLDLCRDRWRRPRLRLVPMPLPAWSAKPSECDALFLPPGQTRIHPPDYA